MNRFLQSVVVLVAVAGLSSGLAGVGASAQSYPNDMAALGDSITRAFNVDGNNWFDNPEHSWSTGYDSGDIVLSHYERIKSLNPAMNGNDHNFAVSGSDMNDLETQAWFAVYEGVDYVTIQMGANDVCTSSPSTMTSTASFRAQFRDAADVLSDWLPGATVYVTSIPDIYQLWSIYDGHWAAEWVWKNADICQSMLSNSRSEADRQFVRQRNIDFNQILEEEAANYGFAWDGNAVFNTAFTRNDVSKNDYFHPSQSGQAKLASVTWAAGPYA